VVTVIFKCESEIWGVPPPKNLAAQKHQNFGFCDLIANISGRAQDIVDRKTAFKTAIIPLRAYQIWWTSVHKRRKIGPWIRPTQSTFSDTHISAHISGAKGRCPLKIFTLVEDDQRLQMHPHWGWVCPQQFFYAWNSKIGQKSGVLWLISSGSVGGIASNFPAWCVPLGA